MRYYQHGEPEKCGKCGKECEEGIMLICKWCDDVYCDDCIDKECFICLNCQNKYLIKKWIDESNFDLKTAVEAYHGTSFSPEKRGADIITSFVEDFNSTFQEIFDEYEPLNDAQQEHVNKLMPEIIDKYVTRCNAYLAAKSRTLSPMITGPANFPVRRNQKAMDTEQKRSEDVIEYLQKAARGLSKGLERRMNVEQVKDLEYRKLCFYCNDTIDAMMYYIRDRKLDNSSYFISMINDYLRKYLKKNGNPELIKKVMDSVSKYAKNLNCDKEIFKEKSGIMKALAVYTEPEPPQDMKSRKIYWSRTDVLNHNYDLILHEDLEYDRTKIEIDPAFWADLKRENKDLQIVAELKKRGWHWSPKAGCWMRKTTQNAWQSGINIFNLIRKLAEEEAE